MNRPDSAGEPSMEEILASIRQIIADKPESEQAVLEPRGFSPAGFGRVVPSDGDQAAVPPLPQRGGSVFDRLSGGLKAQPSPFGSGARAAPSLDDLADILDEPAGTSRSPADAAPKPGRTAALDLSMQVAAPPEPSPLPVAPIEPAAPTAAQHSLPPTAVAAQPPAAAPGFMPPPPFGTRVNGATPVRSPSLSPPPPPSMPPMRKAGFFPPTGMPRREPAPITDIASAVPPPGKAEASASDMPVASPQPASLSMKSEPDLTQAPPLKEQTPSSTTPLSLDQPRSVPAPLAELAPAQVALEPVDEVKTTSPLDALALGLAAAAATVPTAAPVSNVLPPSVAADVLPLASPVMAAPVMAEPAKHGGVSPPAAVYGAGSSSAEAAPTAPGPATVPLETAAPAASVASPPVRSLEDVVADMLRPMLEKWVADNMPRIVEKALREDARSVAGGRPKTT